MVLEKGVVYGKTDIVDFMEGTRSLGELFYNRLTAKGDTVILVSSIIY